MWVLINGLRKPSLEAPGHVTKALQIVNGQKVDDFEPIYSISVNIDFIEKWFVVFEHAFNRLSFGYVRLPQTEYRFSSFFIFSYFCFFFLFLLRLSTFKLLNALYSKFERLTISRRTFA